jgi:hypothetical protein
VYIVSVVPKSEPFEELANPVPVDATLNVIGTLAWATPLDGGNVTVIGTNPLEGNTAS